MNQGLQFFKSQINKTAENSPSPLMRWLNPTLLGAEEGSVEMELEVREEITNVVGQLHGGAIAAIMDDAIGATMFTYGEQAIFTTLNNSVEYYHSAKLNDKIFIKTFVNKKGKQIIYAGCDIWDFNKERLLAKGHSTLLVKKC